MLAQADDGLGKGEKLKVWLTSILFRLVSEKKTVQLISCEA